MADLDLKLARHCIESLAISSEFGTKVQQRQACRIVASFLVLYGEPEQTRLMEHARGLGFAVEYYPGSIRVHWNPKQY